MRLCRSDLAGDDTSRDITVPHLLVRLYPLWASSPLEPTGRLFIRDVHSRSSNPDWTIYARHRDELAAEHDSYDSYRTAAGLHLLAPKVSGGFERSASERGASEILQSNLRRHRLSAGAVAIWISAQSAFFRYTDAVIILHLVLLMA